MKVLQLGDGHRLGLAPQVAIVMLVVGLAGAMAIEPTRQLLEQRSRIAGMTDELREIRQSNRLLENRVERLQDPDYLEQQARSQSGLVRPGETSVIVMPPAKDDPTKVSERDASPPAAERVEERGLVDAMLDFLGLP
ncbi:MAG: septum formation initiator family protein [Actinomycetota bacterium]|nr:septum formation initiator family protein [Actinomycetota bacterium]